MLQQFSAKITKRRIQIALGCLWLLDGALQLQHQMFTASFVRNVIAPVADGQPAFISNAIHFFIRLFLWQPFMCNLLIVLAQLGIGLLIINKSTARYGLLGSTIWGLFVWFVGEGMGNLATGHTLLLMGAPGAALLYAVIALGVWPSDETGKFIRRPADWLAYAWAVLWLGGALLQMVAGQNTTASLASMIKSMADGAPGWLAALDLHAAEMLRHQNQWVIVLLILSQTLIGLVALFSQPFRAIAITAGIVLSLIFWVFGQNLGGYWTGLATDVNTAPLIILLGLAVLGAKPIAVKIT